MLHQDTKAFLYLIEKLSQKFNTHKETHMSFKEMKRLQHIAETNGIVIKTVSDFAKFAKELYFILEKKG